MTDREPTAPADALRPPPIRPSTVTPPPGGLTSDALRDSVSRDDGQPMSVTLVTRPSPRFTATDPPPADPIRAWLAQLPAGLPAFAPVIVAASESCTPAEIHAAARAVACPDLFLVHAPDPVVGERVIAEIARRASDLVLILSPDPAAADRLAERLAPHGVVRALADDENPIRPSPVVAKLTSTALGSGKVEQLKREAAEAVVAAEARLAAFDQIAQLAPRLQALEADLAELTARRDRFPSDARAATDREAVARSIRLRAAQEDPSPRWLTELESVPIELAKLRAELGNHRQQHAEAVAATEKKSGFFARLLRKTPPAGPDPAPIGQQVHALEAEVARLDACLAENRAEFEKRINAELDRHIAEKVAALRAQSESRWLELTSTRDRLRKEIDDLSRPLASPPASRAAPEQELAAARARQTELTAPGLAHHLLARVGVVVGTPGSLQADPVFEALAANGSSFALLILDRCEELTEPDFTRLATLAPRWVLVGEALARPDTHAPRPHGSGNGKPGRNGRAIDAAFTTRLAPLLDRETWVREADRLVCRLMHPSTTAARQSLAREPLLDRPEIELRFAIDASGEPIVAEVAFPYATPIAEAKSFLFHELGEVLLHPCGELQWDHTPSALAARWPTAEHATTDAVWIDLEPGVREKVAGTGLAAFTAAIEFDPTTGWDRATAEAWLAERLPRASASRFAALPGDGAGKKR